MEAIIILDTPVLAAIFATLVAPVGFKFGLVLGVIFGVPTTLVGFEFGLVLGAIFVVIGTTMSWSSYIR